MRDAPNFASSDSSEAINEPPQVVIHAPIDVRSASLGLLAILAVLYTLRWASAVFIPLLLGLLLSYALSPIVNRLQHWRVPRVVSASLLLIVIVGSMSSMMYMLSDDAASLIESLPVAAQRLRVSLRPQRNAPTSSIANVQRAAAELERAANEGAPATASSRPGVMKVEVERPRFNIKDYLWTGTLGLIAAIGQGFMVVLITFFLLVSGDTFRRKMIRLAGPKLSRRRITLEALHEVTAQIQRFLLVQLFTSAIVGLATWLVFLWIGLEHAAVWGLAAAVTNLVPYLGAVVIGAGSALLGYMQFGMVDMALLVGGSSFAIHSIVGYLLTPWLTSRTSRMNAVAIFVGVLAWGWLWGIWGLLLGVPILMIIKAVCDRVEDLKPVGELLGS